MNTRPSKTDKVHFVTKNPNPNFYKRRIPWKVKVKVEGEGECEGGCEWGVRDADAGTG